MTNNKPAVLIADKDEKFLKLLKEQLLSEGFRVFSVQSGREALAFMRRRTIKAAIVDAELKDMEGYILVPLLKDLNKSMKVIMTTCKNDPELESRCRETGIIYYGIKPLDYGEILEVLKSAIKNNNTMENFKK